MNSFRLHWKNKSTVGVKFQILEKEGVPSLQICGRSDHRVSTEQEAKSIYAARAMRGHRFGGVTTTPRCRDLFFLVLFFG